jgi:2,4-dienoyl-CoA reductase-like NADH-dependent reductase (Old Yellow Enzyme family)
LPRLFEPLTLGGLTLPNRIVVSPMCQYICDRRDGVAHDWHLMHLGQFVVAGPGLVFTEATAVSPEGRITPQDLGLYSDECEAALARVVAFARTFGGAKLGIQLAHAGRKASTQRPWDGNGPLGASEGPWETVGPSAVPFAEGWHTPRALDEQGLATVKADFVRATERANRLGFDTIEVHGGHGYLLHQFLSPLANQRTDRYGGSLENRMRFPLEVFDAVRAAFPKERPVGIRVSASDWLEGGWNVDETVALANALFERGCAYMDVTSGGVARAKIPVGLGYQTHFAAEVKRRSKLVTMSVGMIRSPQQAEHVLVSGQADAIVIARGLLDDPHWAWHAAKALGAEAFIPPMYRRVKEG